MGFFYSGEIECMQGRMRRDNLDFILDLLDEYIELVESVAKEADGEMGLFDQYGGVKRKGWMIYKKNVLLIDKTVWSNDLQGAVENWFTTTVSDYNLAFYLGDNGITATYTNSYCSKEIYQSKILPLLKLYEKK